MFLSPADIETLTGRKRPSAQIRWLRRNGWRITVNALGHPNIAVAEFMRRTVGGAVTKQEPNWGAVNGTAANTR